jgi:hypothetical protein
LTGWGQHLRDGDDVPPDVDRMLNKPANLSELRAVLAEIVPLSVPRSAGLTGGE